MQAKSVDQQIQFGAITLDVVRRTVTLSGHAVNFTPGEFAVLEALLEHPGYVRTRAQLLQRLPDADAQPTFDRIIDVYVRNIRRKLLTAKLALGFVETVFGSGYRVTMPDSGARDSTN